MATEFDYPFQKYILKQIAHFGAEGKRLHDTQPLTDYKTLLEAFYFIYRKLGTIEHEVALHKLDNEFSLAWRETRAAWRKIWHDFVTNRQHAIETERKLSSHDAEDEKMLHDLERSYAEMSHKNHELHHSARAVLDAIHEFHKVGSELSTDWKKYTWIILRIDLLNYTVYLRYLASRTAFFVFRHAFIFVASIIVLGIFYSRASGVLITQISFLSSQWPWAAVLTILTYVLKKYYLDPKLKKLQVSMETSRLKPLAIRLHLVRTFALASRTHERVPNPSLKRSTNGRE